MMELRDWDGHVVFANITRVNHVCPIRLNVKPPKAALTAWMTEGDDEEPIYGELVERLEEVALVATAKGADGIRVTRMTLHRCLGHPSFKTVVALTENGANGMVITERITGLDTCAACVAAKAVHFPHKDAADRSITWGVHIDIAGPI